MYYFIASEGLGCNLWKTNGTKDQTQKVESSLSNPYFNSITTLISVNNKLGFFTAREDYYNYGTELWVVDE